MYRLTVNSRATISSTAIFLSQHSRQYRSSPRGSETSRVLQSAQRTGSAALRAIAGIISARAPGARARGAAATGPAGYATHTVTTTTAIVRISRRNPSVSLPAYQTTAAAGFDL